MLVEWVFVVAAATASAVSAASPWSSLALAVKDGTRGNNTRQPPPDSRVFHDMVTALADMQDTYFQRWVGTWPQGIDWTRAVMSTHVAATLRTISAELALSLPDQSGECVVRKEEVISGYFADIIAYYFAEDAFAIRNEAYDDMLWVVLGWLESIQFVDEHGRFASSMASLGLQRTASGAETWYGSRWTPAFAHRARIFWELAAKGWDTTLCGGGMLWNPRLMPYKNAITNELFISASASMYLHFPGDANPSPFASPSERHRSDTSLQPHDPAFLRSARDAHAWLASSNMTNTQGLYADGFHISHNSDDNNNKKKNNGSTSPNNTRCDDRDEMVYTYNQGVLLSGLLGLFRATGQSAYLTEGHALIENVVRATGWDLSRDVPVDTATLTPAPIPTPPVGPQQQQPQPQFRLSRPGKNKKQKPIRKPTSQLPPWHGLGRAGVLEDACDVSGTCSQDAQTFKGIWMHHFAAFCAPAALGTTSGTTTSSSSTGTSNIPTSIPTPAESNNNNNDDDDVPILDPTIADQHAANCRRYIPWLRHNARAALGTRDARGLFGMWWTAGLLLQGPDGADNSALLEQAVAWEVEQEHGTEAEDEGEVMLLSSSSSSSSQAVVDYRNWGVPRNGVWMKTVDSDGSGEKLALPVGGGVGGQKPLGGGVRHQNVGRGQTGSVWLEKRGGDDGKAVGAWDPNLRGRGRTVETQGGGLAVLRALWVVSRHEL